VETTRPGRRNVVLTRNELRPLSFSEFIFILGEEGFVVIPIPVVDKYLLTAYTTENPDGTIRHYHVYLSVPPDVHVNGHGDVPDVDVSSLFVAFE